MKDATIQVCLSTLTDPHVTDLLCHFKCKLRIKRLWWSESSSKQCCSPNEKEETNDFRVPLCELRTPCGPCNNHFWTVSVVWRINNISYTISPMHVYAVVINKIQFHLKYFKSYNGFLLLYFVFNYKILKIISLTGDSQMSWCDSKLRLWTSALESHLQGGHSLFDKQHLE